jgi:hypothetical protein
LNLLNRVQTLIRHSPFYQSPLYQVANPDEERYRVAIDNDLNLEISGRIVSGEYQPGVEATLSFGTREQCLPFQETPKLEFMVTAILILNF